MRHVLVSRGSLAKENFGILNIIFMEKKIAYCHSPPALVESYSKQFSELELQILPQTGATGCVKNFIKIN
jgi:hypothetical protein